MKLIRAETLGKEHLSISATALTLLLGLLLLTCVIVPHSEDATHIPKSCRRACPQKSNKKFKEVSFNGCYYDNLSRLTLVSERTIYPPYDDISICEIDYTNPIRIFEY